MQKLVKLKLPAKRDKSDQKSSSSILLPLLLELFCLK